MKISNSLERFLECSHAKKFIAALIFSVVITGYVTQYAKVASANIAGSVVRFHVIANSDQPHDQQLKLCVRDGVIEYLSDKLEGATDTAQTKAIIKNQLENIQQVAQNTVEENGYTYQVEAVLGDFKFPTKVYGDTRFPAGNYHALRILIGEQNGQNWWCVLYPQLCFTSNNAVKLPQQSKNKLKNVLTEDEFEIISSDNKKVSVEIKFKILELFGA